MEPEAYREMAEVQNQHWWFRARRDILTSLIQSLSLPKTANVLEIGAGPGGNIEMLRQFGNVSAVEMDDYARQIAVKRTTMPLDIRNGFLPENIPFEKGTFDLICLFDVLEHVQDDVGSLRAIMDFVKPGGFVIISVPSYQWLWSKHDIKLHHFRRYSHKEMAKKAQSVGWTVHRASYYNTLLFPIAVATRLADKLKTGGSSLGTQLPSSPINGTLFQIFRSEKFLLKLFNFPFGVTQMVILTK